MKKRIISCLLLLCMVLAIFPTAAFAAEPHTHAVSVDCSTTEGTQMEFTEWNTENALPAAAGHYVLTTDVTIDETWEAPRGGETTLCLNGNTITIECGISDSRGISVQASGTTLNICDCSADHSGAIAVTTSSAADTLRSVSAICNEAHGTLNLYGGNISIVSDYNCYGLELHGVSNICGGTVTATLTEIARNNYNPAVYGIQTSSSDNKNISISGGVFEAQCTAAGADTNTNLRCYGLYVFENNNPNLSVTGGVFIGKAGVSAGMGITINATGGIFSTDPTGAINPSSGAARVIQNTDLGYKTEYAGYYIVEPAPVQPKHTHAVSVDCSTTESDQVEFTEWKPGDFNGRFPSAPGNYVLTDNVNIDSSETWVIGSGVFNLCLNGHTLTMEGSGDILLNSEGSTLNIYDCSEKGTGAIRNVSSHQFLEGIEITHSKAKFNLYGGNIYIESNYSSFDGYAYGVTGSSAYINIYGGTITAKASNNKAVALNISSDTPHFKIYGGVLTAEAPEGKDAYGLYLPSLYTGWNDYDNYGIEGGVFIGRNSIGIGSATTPIEVTGGIFSTDPTGVIDPSYTARKIKATDTGYKAEYAGYYVVEPTPVQPKHTHSVSADCSTTVGTQVEFTPWDGSDMSGDNGAYGVYLKPGSYYLTDNVTISNPLKIDSGDVDLCLNGHTVNITGTVQVSGTLNICDCSVNGGIKHTGSSAAVSAFASGSNVNLYGGTIEGKYGLSLSNGAKNAQIAVYGGTVKGTEYALQVSEEESVLALSGAPVLESGAADIYLNYATLHIGAPLTRPDAAYTVKPYSYTSPANFTSGWKDHMSTVTDLDNYICSVDSRYKVEVDSGTGELKFAEVAPATYTVTVTKSGNGEASATPSSAAAGTEITLTATADSGYHFKEWQVISGGITISNNKFTMPASDVEIRAVFEADAPGAFTVTFNMNGHGTAIDPVTVGSGEKVTRPADPTATGYTFGGWYQEQTCENEWDFDADTVTAATTLYAKWTAETYSVTLNADGATIDSNDVTSYTYGVGATLPTRADMTKIGYRFDGWYESAGFSGSPVTTISATDIGNKTYYAKWIEQHTVSGEITGKDGIQYSDVSAKLVALGGNTVEINSITKTSGESVTPEVYTFSNVTVDAGQYNLVVTAKDTTNSGKEVTVTALVDLTTADKTVTLTLPDSAKSSTVKTSADGTPSVIAGGVDQIAEETAIPDGASSITIELTVDEKQSNDIADDAEKIESVAGGQTIGLYLDIQLQLFKDNETTGANLGSTNTQILELLVPADTSKEGLTVYRVHNGKAGALKKDSADANGEYFTLGEGFVTIYAKKFSVYALGYAPADTYTITLNANGGTVNGSGTATLVTGADKKLSSLPTPTRSGNYTFDGWFTETSGGTQVTTATVFASNQTIYAHWTYTGSTGGGGGGGTPAYSISVDKPENGAVKVNRGTASSDSTVTLTVTPEDGYVLDKLTVTDSQGNNIEVTNKGDGTYTFKMPNRKVTVEAVFVPDGSFSTCTGGNACPIWPYTDADPGAWYHDGVHYCIEHRLMAGYGNNLFKPNADTTRGMITVMLWRLNGSPVVNYALDFEDVAEGQWYTEAIRWAKAEGIATGYGNGRFGTNDTITREQMAAILYRYAQYKGYDITAKADLSRYTDAAQVSSWATDAIRWANAEGLVNGTNAITLNPRGDATRAQAAMIVTRFCQNITK